jgi:hypothetical protein
MMCSYAIRKFAGTGDARIGGDMAERTSYRVVKPEAILHCRETAVASFPKLQYSSMNVVNSLLRVTQVRTRKGEGEG